MPCPLSIVLNSESYYLGNTMYTDDMNHAFINAMFDEFMAHEFYRGWDGNLCIATYICGGEL